MNIKQKIFLAIALLLVFIQFLLFSPGSVEEWSRQEEGKTDKPEQIMTGINLYEKRLEEKDWELQAERAEAISANEDWVLYDVTIKFYGRDMEYLVKAEQAIINTTTSDMKISGDVNLVTTNGFKILTSKMNYQAEKRHLLSPSKTKIISPKDKRGSHVEFEADRIRASLNLNQILAQENVRAVKYERKGRMEIFSDEATFQLDTRSAQFVNKVKILYNNSTVTGPLASLKYDDKQDLFSEMQVSGGTKLVSENRKASANEMIASFIKNYIVLKGKPRVVQDGDELIGETIYLLNGGKRIKVIGAKAQIEDAIESGK